MTLGVVADLNVSVTELNLMRRESGLRLDVENPSPDSSAFGLWQCIKSTCARAAKATGTKYRTTDPYEAIVQMRWYIKNSKHKTPENALAHQIAHQSY